MAETQSVTTPLEPEIVTAEMTIPECGCRAWKTVHVHTLRDGEQGWPGQMGPPSGHEPLKYIPRQDKIAELPIDIDKECNCEVLGKDKVHVHFTVHGPVGPMGPPGAPGISGFNDPHYHYCEPKRESFTVIYNCTWCGNKNPHHHAVMEGRPGEQGEQGPFRRNL